MRRHYYERLEVTGTELVAAFDPTTKDGLVRAVEHLRKVATGGTDHPVRPERRPPLLKTGGEFSTIPSAQSGGHTSSNQEGTLRASPDRRRVFVWLRAVTNVKIANYRWPVNALLSWEQVEGKTEDEIWQQFDSYTDQQIAAFIQSKVIYPL